MSRYDLAPGLLVVEGSAVATWVVAHSAWIILEGAFGDYRVGDEDHFAVQAYGVELETAPNSDRGAELVAENRYRVNGELIFVADDVWVIDFGLRVFGSGEPLPAEAAVGSMVSGEVSLLIDHLVADLDRLEGLPELDYSWRIDRIELDTAPWIEIRPREFMRDPAKPSWRDIDATEAEHENGRADYLVHCSALAGPLGRSMPA